jgi:hypothetical protein
LPNNVRNLHFKISNLFFQGRVLGFQLSDPSLILFPRVGSTVRSLFCRQQCYRTFVALCSKKILDSGMRVGYGILIVICCFTAGCVGRTNWEIRPYEPAADK